MAISYPITAPTSVINIAQISFMADNAVGVSQSPFTYSQQVVSFGGERWKVSVGIPSGILKDKAEPWAAFLTTLRGPFGTFLMAVPNQETPAGGATSLTVSGSAGARTVTSSISGTLNAGDFFSLGSGASTELYKVLQTASGSSLEIWPALRSTHSSSSATINNPSGHFRLTNSGGWAISSSSSYDIQFEAIEVV